jgi:hypothetical protein
MVYKEVGRRIAIFLASFANDFPVEHVAIAGTIIRGAAGQEILATIRREIQEHFPQLRHIEFVDEDPLSTKIGSIAGVSYLVSEETPTIDVVSEPRTIMSSIDSLISFISKKMHRVVEAIGKFVSEDELTLEATTQPMITVNSAAAMLGAS